MACQTSSFLYDPHSTLVFLLYLRLYPHWWSLLTCLQGDSGSATLCQTSVALYVYKTNTPRETQHIIYKLCCQLGVQP